MKKLKLDDLNVTTFATVAASDDRTGTVHANSGTVDSDCSGGPSAGGYCQSYAYNPCTTWTESQNGLPCIH